MRREFGGVDCIAWVFGIITVGVFGLQSVFELINGVYDSHFTFL